MSHRISPPRLRPRRPGAALPAGACDCHAHVFAPAGVYPCAERRPYTPAGGTGLAAYRATLDGTGVPRAVLVHSNIYGPDNRATTDALAEMGGAFRGIALIRPQIDDGALRALAAVGMRGIRINLEFPGETVPDEGNLVDWLAEVVADEAGRAQVLVRNPAPLYGFDVP
ncbi:MAG: amidohydrolase family protein [Geminicoccaceae bacterium]